MTKYVISGYIGFDNFGDEAIAKVLTAHLKNNNAEKITVLSSNPHKTSNLYQTHSEYYLNFIKPIFESDVLISGGGSLLQDITSLKSLAYYLSVILTALLLGKKVVIFAQGFTPFKTKIGKFLTKNIIKYCDAIHVRDSKSQEILKEMGIESNLVADPVFDIEIIEPKYHHGVGIQLRDFHTLTEEFMLNLANEIARNFKDEKIKLFSLQDTLDLNILENFSKMLANKGIDSEIYKNLSVDDCIKKISELEYLIGMRFHSALVATKAGVKVLGINYDIKVLNLAKKLGFPIIGLNDISFTREFEQLKNLNPNDYKIPDFEFPEI